MKSGFVNIIGNPNVGKSTLMNALVGERISIITAKAQTTRHRIMGIVNGDDYQIVYSDTPGILTPHYQMHQAMMNWVNTALTDADVILYVTDVVEQHDKHGDYIAKLKQLKTPVILIVNKIDLTTPEQLETLVTMWHNELPEAQIFPTSALNKFNLDALFKKLVALLPEGPAYYDRDQFTDKSLRFFAGEIIREKILLNYDKEVPYSVEVDIESFEEGEKMYRIAAVIYVARESQKAIIIGHQGQKLSKLGAAARLDMEQFFDKKVFLQLFVKVNPNWRDNERQLRKFGYC
ncbi:GTPase Era [Bacteroidia bacterium]|nr:GTPase Era [Bacteroidia bacterium]